MRYGVCISMGTKDPAGIGADRIVPMAEAGFDYVELPLAQITALDDAAFAAGPLKALREAGIQGECCNNFLPGSLRLTGNQADHAGAIDYARRALDRAAACGCKRVVFGSSGARNVPDGFAVRDGWEQLATVLARFGDEAQARNILLVIEPLNRTESNILNTLAEGLRMVRQVGHPAVAALVDYYHEAMGGDATASLREAKGLLRHVHLARLLGRGMPVHAQEEPYGAFFQGLKDSGYDERISLEAGGGEAFLLRAVQALALLKGIQASLT